MSDTSRVRVCVVGSLMCDMVLRLPRLPHRGETLPATDFGIFLGGKGFNQAIAARRMEASVALVGRVGRDDFGRRLRAALRDNGVDDTGVVDDPEQGTGVAIPLVEPDGANSILIAPRANMRLTPEDIEQARPKIEGADIVLLQLEVALEATEAAAHIARRAGRIVVFNPAPALPFSKTLLTQVDVCTPNEVEAAAIAGFPVTDADTALAAADAIRTLGCRSVVVTLGALGAAVLHGDVRRLLPAHRVDAVDTTAAGDAFNAALAVRLVESGDIERAAAWGNAAGACAVTRLGAEPSLPSRGAVEALIAQGSGHPIP